MPRLLADARKFICHVSKRAWFQLARAESRIRRSKENLQAMSDARKIAAEEKAPVMPARAVESEGKRRPATPAGDDGL